MDCTEKVASRKLFVTNGKIDVVEKFNLQTSCINRLSFFIVPTAVKRISMGSWDPIAKFWAFKLLSLKKIVFILKPRS